MVGRDSQHFIVLLSDIAQIENVCHKIEITTAGVRTPSATFGVAASVGDLQTERQTGSQQRTFIGVLTFLYFFKKS